jgi:hypothetical protein
MADDDVIFKCPQDTIQGKIYTCDSTVFALKKSSLLKLFKNLSECEAQVKTLKKGSP